MNYTNIFKRETKVIAYVVICLTLVVIGVSYALFLQVNNNTDNQVVTAGSLVITYNDGNTIEVDENDPNNCLLPQSDTDGAGKGGCPFTLSIRNDGTLPVQYDLLIYDDALPSGGVAVSHELIRHSLKKQYTVADKVETVTAAAPLSDLKVKEGTKRILDTSTVEVGETITFSLNVWISEEAPTDIIGQYVYLKLDVVGTVFEEEAATTALMSNASANGLMELSSDVSTYEEGEISNKEYRYVGSNPKNYIYYNCSDSTQSSTCEVWRILGIYNIQNGNNIEKRLKIIKNSSDEVIAWDQNGGTDFKTSSLNTYLNEYYDGLFATARGQMDKATYKLGGADTFSLNSKAMYGYEKNSSESIVTTVGLMNVSDYVFASNADDSVLLDSISSKNSDNWLYTGKDEWFINKNSESNVYSLLADGSIGTRPSGDAKLVRPVVYLDSNIKIVSGDGTSSSPYMLSK